MANAQHFPLGWYLIYTRPRHEKKVAAELTEMEVVNLLPLTKQLRIWHDRKKYIEEPLFPSYVFVYLSDVRGYYSALGAKGVQYFVRYGKEIARVQESIIQNIRIVVERGQDVEVTSCKFVPGQQLVIREGPLTGLAGEVVEYNCKQMLLVRVNLLQRNILVSMHAEKVMPAGQAALSYA